MGGREEAMMTAARGEAMTVAREEAMMTVAGEEAMTVAREEKNPRLPSRSPSRSLLSPSPSLSRRRLRRRTTTEVRPTEEEKAERRMVEAEDPEEGVRTTTEEEEQVSHPRHTREAAAMGVDQATTMAVEVEVAEVAERWSWQIPPSPHL
jgi:hypothetical protein